MAAARGDVQLSKTLTWILRHGATKEGLDIDAEGFMAVDKLLQLKQLRVHGHTLDDVLRVVKSDNKQRFFVKEAADCQGRRNLLIRANQGHSMKVESLDLKPIMDATKYPVVVHGSKRQHLDSIEQKGLSRMSRQHIHFAPGLPGQDSVISGMRSSSDLFIYVDLKLALADGFQFFQSANNVILCPGNELGLLPSKYFSDIVVRNQ